MIRALTDWLEDRTGLRSMVNATLFEHIPGGARWRYVWGSTLVFAFSVQLITGFFLWACYSPSSQTAWESVYYIQYEMTGGWLLRGIHHFMAQAMVVLLVLHFAQVLIDGAYRAPREVNFWIGLLLMQVVLGLSLTGYLLPWDQKGYWATQVATNIAGSIPLIGPQVQQIVVGGPTYGHLTLTRFFALHAGLLPFLMIVLIAVHIYVFRRHGITAKKPPQGPDTTFWVDQVLKDGIACLVVLAVVLILVFWKGAELGAPADGSVEYAAARPEWYFLFLYQFLKFNAFKGPNMIYGSVVIPGLVMGVFALMPIIGRWKLGRGFNLAFFGALMLGVLYLTGLAIMHDRKDPKYLAAVKAAREEAERAVVLARSPRQIPAAGALALLQTDPLTQGPRLFAAHCASCHRYDGHDGAGTIPDPKAHPQSAPDLKGFASREWLQGLLSPAIDSPKYFGTTKFKETRMAKFIKEEHQAGGADIIKRMQAVSAALSAEAKLKSQRQIDARDAALIKQGIEAIPVAAGCLDCHMFHGKGDDTGPELTAYGSRQWMIEFLHDPAHAKFYGSRNDRMPAFGAKQVLSTEEIGLIVDWLREDYYVEGETVEATPTTMPTTAPTTSAN